MGDWILPVLDLRSRRAPFWPPVDPPNTIFPSASSSRLPNWKGKSIASPDRLSSLPLVSRLASSMTFWSATCTLRRSSTTNFLNVYVLDFSLLSIATIPSFILHRNDYHVNITTGRLLCFLFGLFRFHGLVAYGFADTGSHRFISMYGVLFGFLSFPTITTKVLYYLVLACFPFLWEILLCQGVTSLLHFRLLLMYNFCLFFSFVTEQGCHLSFSSFSFQNILYMSSNPFFLLFCPFQVTGNKHRRKKLYTASHSTGKLHLPCLFPFLYKKPPLTM